VRIGLVYPYVSVTNARAAPVPEALASPDIILAADCVYFEPAFPLLQSTLRRLTEGRNVEVYMAYKKRRKVLTFGFSSNIKADKRFFTGIRKDFDIVEVRPISHCKQDLTDDLGT
jgi:protein N-lysine methyltransferase METTL21A